MFVISNNCCGGWIYKLLEQRFNNPFIWMLCPSQSIYSLFTYFSDIHWDKFNIAPSEIKTNTYKITVDGQIDIHYVHYVFNPSKSILCDKRSYNRNLPISDNEIEYCRIWEYVVQKYVERVKRMLTLHESPIFLLTDHSTKADTMSIDTVMKCPSKYRRILFTTSNRHSEHDSDTIIKVDSVSNPMQLIKSNIDQLSHIVSSS